VASANTNSPTPYKDVNILLHIMLVQVRALLTSQLVGFYLYGSLSLGDFESASSDVDFVVVTTEEITAEMFERLRDMHNKLASSGLAFSTRLEGSYIPRDALRRYDPEHNTHPHIGVDQPFQRHDHGRGWIIESSIIREHGVVVWGPPPQTLIDPVSPQELREAVYVLLRDFWSRQLDGPDWLRPRDYQAFAVMSLCRALYTLRHGALLTKPQAVIWALKEYPRWRPILERSLLWRADHEIDDLTATMDFLREALAEAQKVCQQFLF
jgi:hypothetical protein